nr:RNA-dependent RNA polymerase [Flumine narna-like virus 42]
MVNADDGLLITNNVGYTAWKRIASFIGLEPSIGKVYFSDSFFNINSSTFIVNHSEYLSKRGIRRISPFTQIPYVNLGLYYGYSRSGTSDEGVGSGALGPKCVQMIQNSLSSTRKSVMRGFLKHNKEYLSKIRVPWFLPTWIGGLGLPRLDRNLRFDRQLAHAVRLNWKRLRPLDLAVGPGGFRVHELALRKLAFSDLETPVHDLTISQQEDFDNSYRLAVCNLLFDSNIDVEDLLPKPGRTDDFKFRLRQNEKVWSNAKKCIVGKPLTWEELEEKKVNHIPRVIFVDRSISVY